MPYQLSVNKKQLNYTIIRSAKRRRSMSLKLCDAGSLVIRSPLFISDHEIHKWLLTRGDWIEKQLASFKTQESLNLSSGYHSGQCHDYLGVTYKLDIQPSTLTQQGVSCQKDKLEISTPYANNPTMVKRLLSQWYRHQAMTVFNERLAFYTELLPWVTALPELKIRAMKTRWGSCSSRGSINLNLHLIKAPLECVDYVIIHELCHLVEFNHSPKFYALMDKYNPSWKEHKKQLDNTHIP